jgi:hypothetical protein
LKNGFLVLLEQSRTKLKDCRKPDHNQMFFEIQNQTQAEPNPKELEPVATLIII